MKIQKQLTILALSFLMSATLFAQSAERTLVKSFNLKGNTSLVLDLDDDVEVQHWDNDLVRIQININLENGSDAILKSLIMAGRYNLKDNIGTDGYVINAPGLEKEITLRGNVLKERLTYTVFAPEKVSVQLSDNSATSLDETKEQSSAL